MHSLAVSQAENEQQDIKRFKEARVGRRKKSCWRGMFRAGTSNTCLQKARKEGTILVE